jgi:hypothetical protein
MLPEIWTQQLLWSVVIVVTIGKNTHFGEHIMGMRCDHGRIRSLLGLGLDEYIQARDELIDDGLIAFDGKLFQVLSLP